MARLSIRIDDEIKNKAEKACDKLGITLTTAINMYLVKLGNEERIPFEVSVDPYFDVDKRERLMEYARKLEGFIGGVDSNKKI